MLGLQPAALLFMVTKRLSRRKYTADNNNSATPLPPLEEQATRDAPRRAPAPLREKVVAMSFGARDGHPGGEASKHTSKLPLTPLLQTDEEAALGARCSVLLEQSCKMRALRH
jgi:hypothetical protein